MFVFKYYSLTCILTCKKNSMGGSVLHKNHNSNLNYFFVFALFANIIYVFWIYWTWDINSMIFFYWHTPLFSTLCKALSINLFLKRLKCSYLDILNQIVTWSNNLFLYIFIHILVFKHLQNQRLVSDSKLEGCLLLNESFTVKWLMYESIFLFSRWYRICSFPLRAVRICPQVYSQLIKKLLLITNM